MIQVGWEEDEGQAANRALIGFGTAENFLWSKHPRQFPISESNCGGRGSYLSCLLEWAARKWGKEPGIHRASFSSTNCPGPGRKPGCPPPGAWEWAQNKGAAGPGSHPGGKVLAAASARPCGDQREEWLLPERCVRTTKLC